MTQPKAMLLDSDILSALMRNHPQVIIRSAVYLQTHHELSFSLMTRYEILRGLKVKGARKRMAAFDVLCAKSEILGIDDAVIVQAAEIYATLHRQGQLVGDADTLIAATALTYGYGVATNNERHFRRVAGLYVENWLK